MVVTSSTWYIGQLLPDTSKCAMPTSPTQCSTTDVNRLVCLMAMAGLRQPNQLNNKAAPPNPYLLTFCSSATWKLLQLRNLSLPTARTRPDWLVSWQQSCNVLVCSWSRIIWSSHCIDGAGLTTDRKEESHCRWYWHRFARDAHISILFRYGITYICSVIDIICCQLLGEPCSPEDLTIATERATTCARRWQHLVWRTREKRIATMDWEQFVPNWLGLAIHGREFSPTHYRSASSTFMCVANRVMRWQDRF